MQVIDITPKINQNVGKIRLAAYCRVSSKSEEQLNSYATQIRYYTDYTKKHSEYELVDIYADEGLTGTERDKRDEFNRLIEDCKKGKIDKIIVKSMTRFVRNIEDCLVVIRMLKEISVSVFFEEQDIDTSKLNSEMIITFPGILAQKESENISGNLRWGIKRRMQSGEFVCSNPPYGYMLVNKKLVVNETEAEVVRRIFDMYLKGVGVQAIARQLYRENVPRRKGYMVWHAQTVLYILRNEKYMGDALLQKKYNTDTLPYRQKKNKGEKAMYYVENYNEPIISKEIFNATKELLEKRQTSIKENKVERILNNILKCPDCGRGFRRQEINGKGYWLCSKFSTGIGDCQHRRVREDAVYETFINMIYKLKGNLNEILGELIQHVEIMQAIVSDSYGRIKQIDKEIADLSAKNLVITKLHVSGVLSMSDFTEQSSAIGNEISRLRTERKKKISEDKDDLALDDLKQLKEIIEEYIPRPKLDKELFEEIIEKIVVEDNATLTFHLIGNVKLTEKIREKYRCKVK